MPERQTPQVEHPVITGPRETYLEQQHPRERRRNRQALAAGIAGAVIGAVVLLVIVWIIEGLTSGSYSAWVYLVAGLLGAAVGPVLTPLVAFARDDGKNATAVREWPARVGTADAPIEGAQRKDLRRRQRW
jgi:hypothetical protein